MFFIYSLFKSLCVSLVNNFIETCQLSTTYQRHYLITLSCGRYKKRKGRGSCSYLAQWFSMTKKVQFKELVVQLPIVLLKWLIKSYSSCPLASPLQGKRLILVAPLKMTKIGTFRIIKTLEGGKHQFPLYQ